MEQQYGFTITNTPVRVMQVGNITSYTFHIERDVNDNTYFENLVVQNDSVGNTSAQIIKYTPFTPMTSFAEHNSYSFEGNTEFSSIIYDDTQIAETGKMVTDCRNLYGFMCNGSFSVSNGVSCNAKSHVPTGMCTEYTAECIKYVFITESCTTYDDGTGDETGGFSPGGGSSYNTGGNNNPVYSDPVCGGNCITEAGNIDPCDKLNNLFLNKQLKVKQNIINELRPDINSNETGEKGVSLLKSLTNYGYQIIPPTTDAQIFFNAGGNLFGAIHTHPLTTFPMFSWSDVLSLYDFHNHLNSSNTDMACLLLVCKDKNNVFQTYAIVFNTEGFNTLDLIFNSPMYAGMSPKRIAGRMDDKLKKKYLKEEKNGTFDYAKAFLEQFSGSNVSLYKANSNLDSWSRLHINTSTNDSMEIPCE